jgi:hypothetical protein
MRSGAWESLRLLGSVLYQEPPCFRSRLKFWRTTRPAAPSPKASEMIQPRTARDRGPPLRFAKSRSSPAMKNKAPNSKASQTSPFLRCRRCLPRGRPDRLGSGLLLVFMKKTLSATRPQDRRAVLSQRRGLKMARSAHAYVRGNTLQFYEWLASATGKLLPQGPPVWICGDCHLGNLGPVADAHGRVKIAIRDLDQTVIGNPAHDLIRLGLSLATAIRGSDLPGVTTALMLEQMVEGYEGELGRKHKHSGNPPSSVQRVLERAARRRWHHLADECIERRNP